eukprot:m51a1_g7373 hypothetical protein (485) ;mRNA; f:72019-73681
MIALHALALAVLGACPALAYTLPRTASPPDPRVSVDLWLNFVNSLDPTLLSAYVDGQLFLRWHDGRPFVPPASAWGRSDWVEFSDGTNGLDGVWTPAPYVANAVDAVVDDEKLRWYNVSQCDCESYNPKASPPCLCGDHHDTCECRGFVPYNWQYAARIRGNVFTPHMGFYDFPFDKPEVHIEIKSYEPVSWMAKPIKTGYSNLYWYLRFLPQTGDTSSTAPVASGIWLLTDVTLDLANSTDARDGSVSIDVVVSFERSSSRLLFRLVLPITLLTAASFVVFWAGRDLATRMGVSSTLMLAVVAFLFVIGSEVPNGVIPYATRMDKFIITCFIIVFLSLVENVLASVLYSLRDEARDEREALREKMLERAVRRAVERSPELAAKVLASERAAGGGLRRVGSRVSDVEALPGDGDALARLQLECGRQAELAAAALRPCGGASEGAGRVARALALLQRQTLADRVDMASRVLFPAALAAALIWFFA